MKYSFEGLIKTEGNRCYMEIPFNVWEETGLKGNIPAKVTTNGIEFECKLVPKGKGQYWIPVPKSLAIELVTDLEVSFEPIEALTRINHNSPYSRKNPIRKIDSIEEIKVQQGYCGHSCVAMLAGVSVPEIQSVMGKASSSWGKIQETLDYYGIVYAEKMTYPRGNQRPLPKCYITYSGDGFKLWYDGRFYGSEAAEDSRIVSYLEIIL